MKRFANLKSVRCSDNELGGNGLNFIRGSMAWFNGFVPRTRESISLLPVCLYARWMLHLFVRISSYYYIYTTVFPCTDTVKQDRLDFLGIGRTVTRRFESTNRSSQKQRYRQNVH